MAPIRSMSILALDAALQRLSERYPRQSQLVELRFFGGLTVRGDGGCPAGAPITVKCDWALARVWLYREMQGRRDDRAS